MWHFQRFYESLHSVVYRKLTSFRICIPPQNFLLRNKIGWFYFYYSKLVFFLFVRLARSFHVHFFSKGFLFLSFCKFFFFNYFCQFHYGFHGKFPFGTGITNAVGGRVWFEKWDGKISMIWAFGKKKENRWKYSSNGFSWYSNKILQKKKAEAETRSLTVRALDFACVLLTLTSLLELR